MFYFKTSFSCLPLKCQSKGGRTLIHAAANGSETKAGGKEKGTQGEFPKPDVSTQLQGFPVSSSEQQHSSARWFWQPGAAVLPGHSFISASVGISLPGASQQGAAAGGAQDLTQPLLPPEHQHPARPSNQTPALMPITCTHVCECETPQRQQVPSLGIRLLCSTGGCSALHGSTDGSTLAKGKQKGGRTARSNYLRNSRWKEQEEV